VITKDNVIEFRKRTNIAVLVHEDAERYTLEIDFKPNTPDLPDCELKSEGLGITLVCWKTGVWTGLGAHEFEIGECGYIPELGRICRGEAVVRRISLMCVITLQNNSRISAGNF